MLIEPTRLRVTEVFRALDAMSIIVGGGPTILNDTTTEGLRKSFDDEGGASDVAVVNSELAAFLNEVSDPKSSSARISNSAYDGASIEKQRASGSTSGGGHLSILGAVQV